MKKKIFFGGVGGIFLTIVGLMFYVVTEMQMVHLMLCSTNQGGTRIPASLCKYYLVNYRINEKGIKELSEGGGLDVVLNIEEDAVEYELAKMLLAKGLNVDGINYYSSKGSTPLQAAVRYNDTRRVKFLIGQGADLHITGDHKMTALEIAKKLHREGDKLQDRREIIQILSDAEKP